MTAVSPVGDYVVFTGIYGFGPNCSDTVRQRMDVIPFDLADSLVTVANLQFVFPSGPDPCGGVICPALDLPGSWSHDGRRLLLPLVQLVGTFDPQLGYYPVTGVNTPLVEFRDLVRRDTTIPGRGLLHPGFSADDSVATFAEFTQVDQNGFATDCSVTRRRATDLTSLTTSPADVAFCQFFSPGPPQIFNIRARFASAHAQPADAARVARDARRPVGYRTALLAQGRTGPRWVQAN